MSDLKTRISKELPLTINDVLLLLNHYSLPKEAEHIYTSVGLKNDGLTTFVSSHCASDPIDAQIKTEDQYEGCVILLIFQGVLPWNLSFRV